MAIYELWLERPEGKYVAHYDRLPPEKGTPNFATTPMESPLAAAHALRNELRRCMTADDQFRVRSRTNIYDNVNDALEDMLRS
jgi:hypothetical protein